MEIEQYQIVLVNHNTRPCVVISPDEMNRHLRTIVVAPMTTRSRLYPTRVKLRHNNKTGWIAVDQIRTIDRKRIIRIEGALTASVISRLKDVIRECYLE